MVKLWGKYVTQRMLSRKWRELNNIGVEVISRLNSLFMGRSTGSSKRKGPKFGEGSSVRAEGLCVGCLSLKVVVEREIQTCSNSFLASCTG